MTLLNGIKVYGKNIHELNTDERNLLMVDCSMAIIMVNFNPDELDEQMFINMKELSSLRAKISTKCAGYDESLYNILPPDELIFKIENSNYSYQKFIDTNINFANLILMLNGNVNIHYN